MQRVEILPWHIRPDRIALVVKVLQSGGIVALPTDTTWTLVCDAAQRSASQKLETMRSGRHPERQSNAPMSLLCSSLAMISTFVVLDQPQFRLVRRLLPGPYTIILPASREVPKQLQSKRKTVGIRLPEHAVAIAVLEAFGHPLLGSTAQRPDGELCDSAPAVEEVYGRDLDLVVDTEPFVPEPSTVIEYTDSEPLVIREGKGAVEPAWGRAAD